MQTPDATGAKEALLDSAQGVLYTSADVLVTLVVEPLGVSGSRNLRGDPSSEVVDRTIGEVGSGALINRFSRVENVSSV